MRLIDKIKGLTGSSDGASEEEIRALEAHFGASLPEDYREFLLWMGRYSYIYDGSDVYVNHIIKNTALLPELLSDNGHSESLPLQYVCPFMHQGYLAVWFALPSPDPDPPAFIFNEGQPELGIVVGKSLMEVFFDDFSDDGALITKQN